MSTSLSKKVLLIGWDAADWKVITPLIDEGKMPNMGRFLDRGAMGNLATLYPVLSPMLWTSIATGKRAYKHGVHGFAEPDPSGAGVRPVTNTSRNTKALWNILNQEGKQSNVVGWWPTDPVEPINGVMVSNHYQSAPKDYTKGWPVKPGTIHPQRLLEPLAKLRVRPEEIEGDMLLPFVPKAPEVDQQKDQRLFSIAKILAETASIQAAATAIMQLEPWDFMAVYFDAIDHFGHGFMRYHPPRSPWIAEADFELYKGVIEAAYRFHDMMLGVLMELAGEDTTIIIVSDHGFHPDRLRPHHLPNEPAGPAEEHRPFGIVAMNGPGIKQDELIFGASLLDITPTILTLMGLPIGRDMDGKPLVNAFTEVPELAYIDSWDAVEGDAAMLPEDQQVDPVDSQEAIQQLVDLGYIDEPGQDQQEAIANTVRELKYNLARAYIGANHQREAIPLLQELWEQFPEENRFGLKLFEAYLAIQQVQEARQTLENLVVSKQKCATEAQQQLKDWQGKLKDKKPEEIDQKTQQTIRRLRGRAATNMNTLAYLQGALLQAEGKHAEALKSFEQAKKVQLHNQPSLYLKIADVYMAQRDYDMAESNLHYVLEIDPVNPQAQYGLCRCYIKQRRNQEAIDAAVATLGLHHHNPRAHYLLGVALRRVGRKDEAVKALETAISLNPVFPSAHRVLAALYQHHCQDPELAATHRRLSRESQRRIRQFKAGEIPLGTTPADVQDWQRKTETVDQLRHNASVAESIMLVSGLPRSGTSMMMQMLAAGGLSVLTDGERVADESNQKGYYELEKVKQLAPNSQWLKEAEGQGVKVIAQLLPRLPRQLSYRVIFMQRPLEEVVASQHKMLKHLGKKGGKLNDEQLSQTYVKQLNNIQRLIECNPQFSVLYVDYNQALSEPVTVAKQVNEFLDGQLDEAGMASAVMPDLSHHRSKAAEVSA